MSFPTGNHIGNLMWDFHTMKLGSASSRPLILVVISVDVAMPILALFSLSLNPLPAVWRVCIHKRGLENAGTINRQCSRSRTYR
ncbi:hypothetical protein, partial [Pseudorhizobium marinum]|uniref:hypothetical protein n=1 Tax=Pseudorhizobium marinum TaxID=1496690 RepID=UPI001AEBF04E